MENRFLRPFPTSSHNPFSSSGAIHPVFYVSLLKKVIGNSVSVAASLPPDDSPMQEPEGVLDTRLKNKGRRVISQVLIKWKGWPPELSTWEDEDQVRHLLPTATTCG